MSLYAQTSGSGPGLLLIHGWSLHGGIWDRLLPLLEPHFSVTCVDLPGHGRSDWQGEETLDAMVEAVLSVAPAKAAWLGWSLGGLVAMRAALMAPGQVTALITLASSPCFVRRPGWESAMLPSLLETFSAELQQDYARTLNRFLSLQVRGSEHASRVLKTLRKTLLAHGEPDAACLSAGLELLRTTDLRNDLGEVACKALLLMGERDTLVPQRAGSETAALLADAQLAVIEGAGHAPFLAEPDAVAEQINNFLS